jgi:vacuolar-type H+-ATPase subunit I/STV1
MKSHAHTRQTKQQRRPKGAAATAIRPYSSTKQRRPINEQVAAAIALVTDLQQVGASMTASAAPITKLKAETIPSLTELSIHLKQLSDLLTLRKELVNQTLENLSDSIKSSGKSTQDVASRIRKELEALAVQLSIEKQFSRYLT